MEGEKERVLKYRTKNKKLNQCQLEGGGQAAEFYFFPDLCLLPVSNSKGVCCSTRGSVGSVFICRFVGGCILFVMLVGVWRVPDILHLFLHVLEPGAAGILGQVK